MLSAAIVDEDEDADADDDADDDAAALVVEFVVVRVIVVVDKSPVLMVPAETKRPQRSESAENGKSATQYGISASTPAVTYLMSFV